MSILRDNTVDLAMRLRNPEVQAYVADQIEEAQLQVPLFNRLDILADDVLALYLSGSWS